MYRNSLHVIPKCIRLCPCFYRFKMSERHAGTLPRFVLWCGRASSECRNRLFRKLIRAFLRGGKAFFVKPDFLFRTPFRAFRWYPGCYAYALKSAYTEAKYMLSGYTRFSVSLRCVVCRFFSTIMRVAKKTPTTRLARCDDVMRNVDWNCWWKKVETQDFASPEQSTPICIHQKTVAARLAHCDDVVRIVDWNLWWRKVETQDFASPDFICMFYIDVFRVNKVCDGLLVRRKILRLYKGFIPICI